MLGARMCMRADTLIEMVVELVREGFCDEAIDITSCSTQDE